MNERIRELAEQAKKYALDAMIKITDKEQALKVYSASYDTKFAELIIRECVEVCHKMAEDSDSYVVHDGDTCAEQIKKHFGVEDNSIKVGSRVKVVSGFNVGAKGTVSYIEPTGRMWVRRDGSSSDVFYHPEEVIGVEE